jgi:hypothetical protein
VWSPYSYIFSLVSSASQFILTHSFEGNSTEALILAKERIGTPEIHITAEGFSAAGVVEGLRHFWG